jgi:hypothetical protein
MLVKMSSHSTDFQNVSKNDPEFEISRRGRPWSMGYSSVPFDFLSASTRFAVPGGLPAGHVEGGQS